MARKPKELYYEILPDDEPQNEDAGGQTELPAPPDTATATRDRYAELKAAAERIDRVRFRVKPDYTSRIGLIVMVLTAVILVGGVFMYIIGSNVGTIVIGAVMVVAVIAAIGTMIAQTVKMKAVYYCYFARTDGGFICMSAMDDCAAVLAADRAYCIDGDAFFAVDAEEYREFYDGEGTGLFAVIAADRESVEYDEDGEFYFVRGRSGGGHTVFLEDGEIVRIVSDVPRRTDEIDRSTGESKIKLVRYEKVEPTRNFAWEIPPFVADAFDRAGVPLPKID